MPQLFVGPVEEVEAPVGVLLFPVAGIFAHRIQSVERFPGSALAGALSILAGNKPTPTASSLQAPAFCNGGMSLNVPL